MTRLEKIKTMDTKEFASWLMQMDQMDLGQLYCKSDCDTGDDYTCPHPMECLIRWLGEDNG